ncbi:hypothetical protein TNIN_369421, partial [Trichonephila inaurata madagascariensis]
HAAENTCLGHRMIGSGSSSVMSRNSDRIAIGDVLSAKKNAGVNSSSSIVEKDHYSRLTQMA